MFFGASHPALDRGSIRTFSHGRLSGVAGVLLLAITAWIVDLGLPTAAVALASGWMAVCLTWHRVLLAPRNPVATERMVFGSLCLDAVVIAALVAFAGGAWWCAPMLYTMIVAATATLLERRRVVAFGALAIGALSLVYALQVTGALPSSPFLGAPSMRGQWSAAIAGVIIVTVELTSLAWAQQFMTVALRVRAIRYRALMDATSDVFIVITHQGDITSANRAALALAQCRRRELLRDGIRRLMVDEDMAFFTSRIPRALGGEQQSVMVRARAVHGVRWLSCTLAPMAPGVRDSDLLVILRDVTDERFVADSVRHSEARLRAVFEQAAISIALLDIDGVFSEVNPAIERLLGADAASLIGRPLDSVSPPEDVVPLQSTIEGLRSGVRQTVTCEQRVVRRDGRVLWTSLTLTRVNNPGGAPGLIAMMLDVTAQRALEAQLTWQAFHDPLTNLANRALFRTRVERALALPASKPGSVAVLFLDLDNFKNINDSMGHAAGDALLFEVSHRLLNATRGCDTVARLGGDEFAVLVDNVQTPNDCVRVADRILRAMEQPIVLHGTAVRIGTSIGIVRDIPGDSADDILRNADVAMYSAKQRGKGRHSLFEPSMHNKAVERLRLQTDLREAIDSDQISLRFQPIVTLHDGKPCGFETLARWAHPEFGDVSPSIFVPIAEETGLIVPLGQRILLMACAEASRWPSTRSGDLPAGITVNLSGRQLEEPSVVEHVREALRVSGLAPSRLTLEITESALVQHSDTMLDRLHQLKALGISLAIDDFGTGYSSLSYIQQFPVDVLKIDRSFVEGLGRSNGTDAALARTIIALGASLGLRTVAEGIETDGQRAMLRELGCEYGQGFFYARPMTAAELLDWLPTGGAPGDPTCRRGPLARKERDTDELRLIPA
jgi:diguanylate cyclase (GGDEF)-like protein/PAS domain S-box-containing protein